MKTEDRTLTKPFTATEIKKLVYKQKPKAQFVMIRMGVAYYKFDVVADIVQSFTEDETNRLGFEFQIPVEDMGTADFHQTMEAKHLLRWLNEEVQYFTHDKGLDVE